MRGVGGGKGDKGRNRVRVKKSNACLFRLETMALLSIYSMSASARWVSGIITSKLLIPSRGN